MLVQKRQIGLGRIWSASPLGFKTLCISENSVGRSRMCSNTFEENSISKLALENGIFSPS